MVWVFERHQQSPSGNLEMSRVFTSVAKVAATAEEWCLGCSRTASNLISVPDGSDKHVGSITSGIMGGA